MKTLDQIKDEVANEYGYPCYEEYENEMINYNSCVDVNEVAKRYAREVAMEALKNSAENVDFRNFLTAESKYDLEINTDSTTNESNIPEL